MNKNLSREKINPAQDDSHQLSLLLRSAYFAMRRRCNSLCNDHGCNGDQFVILSVLAECDSGVTQAELVNQSGYDPATIGAMLRNLEEKKLVRRKPHPDDGRAKLVSITASGRKLFQSLWESTLPVRENLWRSVKAGDRAATTRSLKSIVETME
jgi:DNA-binding MarR family transcriptional regulator